MMMPRGLVMSEREEFQRERLAAIAATGDEGVIEETLEGIVTGWSEGAERIYGYSAEEMLGRQVEIVVPPELLPEALALFGRARAGDVIPEVETTRYTRDGRRIEITLAVTPVRDARGQVIGTSTIVRDITARRSAERMIEESAGLFRTTFEDAPIGMALFHLDRTVLRVNRALCDLLGYTEAELLAMRFRDVTYPDDLPETIRLVEGAISGEVPTYEHEIRLVRKDGRVVWTVARSSLVRDRDGVPFYFTAQFLDITERKEAEAVEAATHQRTRQVLERITDGFLALDLEWRFTYINETAEALLGHPRGQLLGQNIWDTFPIIVDSPVYETYHRAMAQGSTESVELYFSGSDLWVDIRAYPSPEGLSVFFRDVSESKRLVQDLRASEEKYRALVDHLPAVTYLLSTDAQQTAIYFSPGLEALTGYTPEEALRRPAGWNWLEAIHPDDRARVAAEDARTVAAGEPLHIEYRYIRKDGSYVWVRDEAVPIHDPDGQIVAWQGVLLDIDARVRAEQERAQLAAIVDAAEDGILSCDLDGTILSWNPGAERLYGYRADEIIGRNVVLLRPPELQRDIGHLVARVKQGESLSGQETVRLTNDGRRIDISLSLSPMRDASGEIVGIASISRDITALREAEAALRLRERALDAAPSGIIIASLSSGEPRIVDVNPAFETTTGYGLDEVLGQDFSVLHGPETDQDALQRIGANLIAGQDARETLVNYRKDGAPYWAEVQMALVRDASGTVTNIVGIHTDVTAMKEAEAALARERDLLQTLLEHLPDGVYIKDTRSRFVQLNQATASQLGLTDPALAIGQTDREFFPPALAEEYLADEEHVFATGEPLVNKAERQIVGGEERWVLATKAPLRDASGTMIGLVGVNRDVTDRIQTEFTRARLAAIVDSAEDAIISRTLEGIITSWNQGSERLYGYTAEEAIGQSFTLLLPEDIQLAAWDQTEAFGAPLTRFEAVRRRKDGSLVDVSIAMSPIRDDAGEIIGVSTVTRDITERKRIEQELREALEAAQAATRTKSLFLSMMSHELRTPLQAVLGYADLLQLGPEGSLTPEQMEDLSHIQRGARRMITLIEQMLDLSRMEAGRLELAAEPVDLAEIIEEVRQDVAPQAAAKGLALDIDLPAALPPALGDPDRLRQILLNLAGNAVKFTDAGSVRITACETAAGIEVDVCDTGIGIGDEALPYIFEEFRQVDGNLTRRYGGAGLGLAIARRLAEQMGGTLTVDSTVGEGSTFTLVMPAAG